MNASVKIVPNKLHLKDLNQTNECFYNYSFCLSVCLRVTSLWRHTISGLYFKTSTIVIYIRYDSTIIIYDHNDSGQHY